MEQVREDGWKVSTIYLNRTRLTSPCGRLHFDGNTEPECVEKAQAMLQELEDDVSR